MFNLTFENPYVYVDSYKDEYSFHIFTDLQDNKHISIKVTYVNSKKSIPIFGYEVLGHNFALPFDGESIVWNAYDKVSGSGPRGKCMSEEARKMVNKILKLKVFL